MGNFCHINEQKIQAKDTYSYTNTDYRYLDQRCFPVVRHTCRISSCSNSAVSHFC